VETCDVNTVREIRGLTSSKGFHILIQTRWVKLADSGSTVTLLPHFVLLSKRLNRFPWNTKAGPSWRDWIVLVFFIITLILCL